MNGAIDSFYESGWVGFALVMAYNIGYLALWISDIYVDLSETNRRLMEGTRKAYYSQMLSEHEQRGGVSVALLNEWVKLGNLNDRDYSTQPDINLRVELFRIMPQKKGYLIEVKKIVKVFLNP